MTLHFRATQFKPGILRALKIVAAMLTLVVVVFVGVVGYNISPRYYWFMAGAVAPASLFLYLRRAHRMAVGRAEAAKRWGAAGSSLKRVRHTRFDQMRRRYLEHTQDPVAGFVDDRTWADLEMDDIVAELDVCFTIAGRNELLRILRHSLPEPDRLDRLISAVASCRSDEGGRDRVGRVLATIGEEADADPASLLWGHPLKRDRLYPLFVILAVLAGLSIALTAAVSITFGLICIFLVFVTNMWVYFRKARYLSVDIPSLRLLARMMAAVREVPDMARGKAPATGVRGSFRVLLTGAPSPVPSMSGDITEMLLMYFKIFFQVDLLAYGRIVRHLHKEREAYRDLYQSIGSADAAFALASFRQRQPTVCDASRTATGEDGCGIVLELEEVYHPLVPDAVANSAKLVRPGAVVTGTNMAGKSTFLRTVGINVLFAQTAGFAFASGYRAGSVRVLSSINKHDDLSEGKSYYYDEAQRIYDMIEDVDSEITSLLLIDELLAGTNSLERESASMAILGYLADRNALTIAATHDVTIARGVGDRYALYYFTDKADENGLVFDYRIQKGVVSTRNAIKLLRLIGYPSDVIDDALERTKDD